MLRKCTSSGRRDRAEKFSCEPPKRGGRVSSLYLFSKLDTFSKLKVLNVSDSMRPAFPCSMLSSFPGESTSLFLFPQQPTGVMSFKSKHSVAPDLEIKGEIQYAS